ncbi:hypothetical protein MXM41_11540 [Leclercia adecarboxylata]|uniref:hypothetical protein n=1 Tax=Leclercia adecarboxylata TaxID=83655 RepID=UPI002DBBDFF4|nr:hypothetical protein [Leclercia adecarboxylata]MEB6379558.1 hypothetical protein [Leclercia adecarboxylata]
MRVLSNHEMQHVDGAGPILDSLGSLLYRITNPKNSDPVVDPFMDNMKKMFGASAGRDLAKIVQKIGLVDVVNSIFGW